jgi:hypothetical protein
MNESDYNVTYGSTLSFDLTLSGDAVNNPNSNAIFGTTFALSLFDSTFINTLLNPNGPVLEIDIAAGTGGITVTPFTPAATATLATPPSTGVPEPSSLFLLGVGLAACGYLRARRGRQPTHQRFNPSQS